MALLFLTKALWCCSGESLGAPSFTFLSLTGFYQNLHQKQGGFFFLETFIQDVSDRHVFSVRLEEKC